MPTPAPLDAFQSFMRDIVLTALPDLATSGTSPARVGWENRPITPPSDGASLWVTEVNRYGIEQVTDDGAPRPTEATPFYQLLVYATAGEGNARLNAAYAAITAALPLRVPRLDASGTIQVTCLTQEPGPVGVLVQPAGWAMRPVRLGLHVYRYADAQTGASQPLAASGLAAVTFGQLNPPRPVLAAVA